MSHAVHAGQRLAFCYMVPGKQLGDCAVPWRDVIAVDSAPVLLTRDAYSLLENGARAALPEHLLSLFDRSWLWRSNALTRPRRLRADSAGRHRDAPAHNGRAELIWRRH